jgi:thiol-disulfide isomerase/thioredoxin
MSKYVSFGNTDLQSGGSAGFMDTMKTTVANNKLTIIAIFAFIGIAVYLYFTYLAPKFAPAFKVNEERKTSGGGNKTAEMFLFYVDWCPHCKTAKPEWNDLKAEYENKEINGYKVIFTEVNCTTESPEIEKMMNTYKIDGFPTIKLLKDGQVIEYDAKPTKETMEQFLNTVL